MGSEGHLAGRVVGEDVVDEVNEAGVGHPGVFLQRLGFVLIENVALAIGDLQDGHRRDVAALVGKGGVGVDHIQQAHLAAAQGQGKAVKVHPSLQSGDAEAVSGMDGLFHSGVLDHLDRRHVERTAQSVT